MAIEATRIRETEAITEKRTSIYGCTLHVDETTRLGEDLSRIVAEYFDVAELRLRNQVDNAVKRNGWSLPKQDTQIYYASQGEIEVLNVFITRWPAFFMGQMYKVAAKSGNLAVAQWVHQQSRDRLEWRNWDVALIAARMGHLELLRWALTLDDFNVNERTASGPHYGKAFNILKLEAMKGGQYTTLMLLHDKFAWKNVRNNFCERAAIGGSVAILRWLRETLHCTWDERVCRTERVCQTAAEHGNLDFLQWARDNGAP